MKQKIKNILRPYKNYIVYHIMKQQRAKCDYFDVDSFMTDLPLYGFPDLPGIQGNKCYGNYNVLQHALGYDFHPRSMVEHGLYFAEYVIEGECTMDCIDTIYTYSNYRKNAILKHFGGKIDKEIITVGPYIQYAPNFKTKSELATLKANLGKVLLVFPSHSFADEDAIYDFNEFSKCIDEMAVSYDSVLISMLGYDIQQGLDKQYRDKGYKIVSSGTRNDPYFLSRQRDLMELADMTVSNDVGTHIGYSICLGTPHYIFDQKITAIKKAASAHASDYLQNTREREYAEIKSVFNSREPVITPEQIAMVKKYWGEFNVK